MPLSLTPRRLFESYREVTPEILRRSGVTLLLSDLDYTLAPKSCRRPDQDLRVEEFCGDLGIGYQGHAGKPSTRGLRAAMERAGASPDHTAMLGDKLLTDMLAANRAGVLALMVEPLGGAVTLWQKVLHALQSPFKALCRRRGGQEV